jgi:hypothetical protein
LTWHHYIQIPLRSPEHLVQFSSHKIHREHISHVLFCVCVCTYKLSIWPLVGVKEIERHKIIAVYNVLEPGSLERWYIMMIMSWKNVSLSASLELWDKVKNYVSASMLEVSTLIVALLDFKFLKNNFWIKTSN